MDRSMRVVSSTLDYNGGIMLPFYFRQQRVLARLNILSVPLSLAAATSSFFGLMTPDLGIITALTTLVVGWLWMLALRSPRMLGHIRLGWILSIPLAMLNAAAALIALGLRDQELSIGSLVENVFLGITVGAIFWIPALVATLLFFGVPIARAQHLSKQGLAGEQRGEILVGLSAFFVALVTLVLTHQKLIHQKHDAGLGSIAVWLTRSLAIVGGLLGSSASLFALSSERRRRDFVARVEAGENRQFRIENTQEGKVLLRVSDREEDYRVADFEEELALLDDTGRTQKLLFSEARAQEPHTPPRG